MMRNCIPKAQVLPHRLEGVQPPNGSCRCSASRNNELQMQTTYSIVGLGKLGASMAVAIASRGFQVIGSVSLANRSIC